MGWLAKFFGYRTSLAPSGSQSLSEVQQAARVAAAYLGSATGVEVGIASVSNTNSMLPVFDSNAVLLLERIPYNRLREGDLVTYHANLLLIVHRLNGLTKKGWEVVGDGNALMDGVLVTPANFDRRVCGIFYAVKEANTDR